MRAEAARAEVFEHGGEQYHTGEDFPLPFCIFVRDFVLLAAIYLKDGADRRPRELRVPREARLHRQLPRRRGPSLRVRTLLNPPDHPKSQVTAHVNFHCPCTPLKHELVGPRSPNADA